MKKFSLEDLLSSAAQRMKADLNERLTAHPGELGADREEIVRSFLRSYLPRRFEVSTGFVFDSSGNLSKQIDVIIADQLVCARFETIGGARYYPCESVVAVGEIKSSITSEYKLYEAFDNLESVKILDRSAAGKAVDTRFGETIDHTSNHLHQIFSFLLIIGKSISSRTIHEYFLNYILSHQYYTWPNMVLALNNYLVTFCCDRGVCPNPMDARGVAVQLAEDSPDLVMRFFLMLGQAIETTRVSGLPYWEYLSIVKKWTATAYFSTTDDPPPYLSSISI